MEWANVNIPKSQVQRIKRVKALLGYSSVNQFVQEAVRIFLVTKEGEYDAVQEDLKTGKQQREGWND